MGSGCHGDKASLWGHEKVLKLIVVMAAQPVNALNTTELCVLNRWFPWYVNSLSLKTVSRKKAGKAGATRHGAAEGPSLPALTWAPANPNL